MTKIAVACGIALTIATARADPPAPAPDGGAVSDKLSSGAGSERPWANGVSQDHQDAAIRLFIEGNGYLNDGIFTKAVETYHEALKHWDHPAIHFNMALALTKLDRPLEVEISLQKSIAYGPAPLETPDKFEHAKEYLVLNAKQLAWIDVSCDKVGAKVAIDGKDVFTVEKGKRNRYEGRVTVGKHTVVAAKTGYNAQVDAPYVEPGQKFRIELKLYTSDELTRHRRRWDARWMPYTVIFGGVVVGALGGVLQLSAQSSYADFDKAVASCNADSGGGGCASGGTLTALRDSGDTKRVIGYVGYGISAAAIATGALLIYLNRETSYEITADEYRRQVATKPVAIAPMVTPGTAGAMVLGRF